MLRLKRDFRRRISRDSTEDLSIISGIPPIRRIASFRKQARRVRQPSNFTLLKHFNAARELAAAAAAMNSRLGATANPQNLSDPAAANASKARLANSSAAPYTTSPYFTQDENGVMSSYDQQQHQQQNGSRGGGGSGSVGGTRGLSQWKGPSSVSTPTSRPSTVGGALARRQLFPVAVPSPSSQSSYSGGGSQMGSEVEYWATLSSSGRAKRNLMSRGGSEWAMSSGPISRNDAYSIQREAAYGLGCGSTEGFHGLPATSGPPAASCFTPNQDQARPFADNRTPMKSLLRSIQPPPSAQSSVGLRTPSISSPWTPVAGHGVVQGDWVSRETPKHCIITKQYSIAQLIDVLTGDAVPPTSELAGHVFQPDTVGVETVDANNVHVPNLGLPMQAEIPVTPKKSRRHKKDKGTRKQSRSRPLHEINRSWFNSQNQEELGKSMYFANDMAPPPSPSGATSVSIKSKSVSFMMDSQDNVAVQTFFFENPTQGSTPNSAPAAVPFFDQDKENQSSQPPEEYPFDQTPTPTSLEDFLRSVPPELPPCFPTFDPRSPSGEMFIGQQQLQSASQSVLPSSLEQPSGPEFLLSTMGNDQANEIVLDTQATYTC